MTMLVCRPHYNGVGGRRSADLIGLVDMARDYTHIFVIVGDNDVNSLDICYIYKNYRAFSRAVWPSKVMFSGHLRRKDLDADLVANNNIYLSNMLENQYKSPKLVKREDFDDYEGFHLNRNGN